MPVLADNDVIVHRDAERLGDVDDRLGHIDVGARGRGVATRMVVHDAIARTYSVENTRISDLSRPTWGWRLGAVSYAPA